MGGKNDIVTHITWGFRFLFETCGVFSIMTMMNHQPTAGLEEVPADAKDWRFPKLSKSDKTLFQSHKRNCLKV